MTPVAVTPGRLSRSLDLTRGCWLRIALGQLLVAGVAAATIAAITVGAGRDPRGRLASAAADGSFHFGLVPIAILTALALPLIGAAVAYRALAAEQPVPAALREIFE